MNSFDGNITTFKKLDLELFFVTEVLKLNSLHYGYWEDCDVRDIDGLRTAQSRYSEKLISWIPSDVTSILDVGSGIGDNARLLASKGYRVTAMSPDVNHGTRYESMENVAFVNTTFEEFRSPDKYDLILMSESQNYFDTTVGFEQTVKYLNPCGYLFVLGKFRNAHTPEFSSVTNVYDEYLDVAKFHGLNAIRSEDITPHAVPTLELAGKWLSEYGMPMRRLFEYYVLKNRSPRALILRSLLWVLSPLYKHELGRITDAYEQHLNTEFFQQYVRYQMVLFRCAV